MLSHLNSLRTQELVTSNFLTSLISQTQAMKMHQGIFSPDETFSEENLGGIVLVGKMRGTLGNYMKKNLAKKNK